MPKANQRNGMLVKAGVAVAVIAVAGVSVLALTSGGNEASDQRGGTLEVHDVGRMSFEIVTSAGGELEARKSIEVRNPLRNQSTIMEVVAEGTQVKKGEILVKLNSEQIENQVKDQELTVSSSTASLFAAEQQLEMQKRQNATNIAQAQLKVDLAELALDKWKKGEVEQKRQDNEQAVNKATRERERLNERLENTRLLFKEGFASADELKQDEQAAIDAAHNLDKAELTQKIYQDYEYPEAEKTKNSDLAQAEAALEQAQAQAEIDLRLKESDRDAKKTTLDRHAERLAELRVQFEGCTIKAPADGLVVYGTTLERSRWGGFGESSMQIGSEVYPNQLLVVLPDISEMVASVRVHESLAGKIRPGQPATVTIDAVGGRKFAGTVASIGVLAESGGWRDPNLREYTVKISVERGDGVELLKPSMRCDAELTLGDVENVLAVPTQAVFNEGLLRYALVRSGGKWTRRPVAVGRRSDRFAEITAGLTSGDRVLLRDPKPGEVLGGDWDDKALAAVGLTRDENGRIGRVGGDPEGRPQRGPRPDGETPVVPAAADVEAPAEVPAADSADDVSAAVTGK